MPTYLFFPHSGVLEILCFFFSPECLKREKNRNVVGTRSTHNEAGFLYTPDYKDIDGTHCMDHHEWVLSMSIHPSWFLTAKIQYKRLTHILTFLGFKCILVQYLFPLRLCSNKKSIMGKFFINALSIMNDKKNFNYHLPWLHIHHVHFSMWIN